MIYGYARVSTDGQSVDAQVRQLTKAGCKIGSQDSISCPAVFGVAWKTPLP